MLRTCGLSSRCFGLRANVGNGGFLKFRNCGLNQVIPVRNSSSKGTPKKDVPRIRYLFYMTVLSWGFLYLATGQINKPKPKTSFESEREFKEYEESTGLRRRNKLINFEKNSHYKFYAVPFVKSDEEIESIAEKLQHYDPEKQVKVIDPKQLIEIEKTDESKKYCFLLQDLDASHRSYPKGLITALIKEEIQLFLNTRSGTFDTNIILKNYPQTTEDAIKFENDVSDIQKCLVFNYGDDLVSESSATISPQDKRAIDNVVGYFETVGRVKHLNWKKDQSQDKLREFLLEDM